MRKYFDSKENKVIAIFLVLALVLGLRLFVLSVLEGEQWRDNANSITIKGIYTNSPRGNIYDRNGKEIAGNEQIFTVKMSSGNMENDEINHVALKLVDILDKNKEKYNNNFPIKMKDGEFVYTYEEDIRKWKKENKIKENATAEQTFETLKERYGITKVDRYEAMAELQTKYSVYPPISTSSMTFKSKSEIKYFLQSYGIDADEEPVSANEAFKLVRENYEIDDSVSNGDAMKIMAVRYELKAMGYKKYLPATIAKDISDKTIMEVEEKSEDLPGVDVVSETRRNYPEGEFASHILGYMGQIAPEDQSEYEKKGYASSSVIGKEGIERIYEPILKGQDGTSIVRVDAMGNYVETLEKIDPKKGRDVYLTIDKDLQKVAEKGLEANVKACHGGGFQSKYGDIGLEPAPNAESGAVVALEVETGEVLALANYPDYDPNLFSDGISSENWDKLQSENPRDSLSPAPLYNTATMTAVQPGSTFKPITALAALECGLDPDKPYRDDGYIKMGDRTFGCVAWNMFGTTHGYVDLYKAIQVSCNYYFFDLITNKDWASGGSMGLDKDMGIPKVLKMASRFGLGSPTGIELSESVVPLPSEEKNRNALQRSLEYVLYANAETYFTKDVYTNNKRLTKDVETISSWIHEKGITYNDMYYDYLPTVGVKKSQYQAVTELCLYTYFYHAEWGVGDAFNLSIGQGDHAYTPIQMARYVAALGNDGMMNEVKLVKSIEDEGDLERKKPVSTKVSKKNIDIVKEGMHRVTTGEGSGISAHYVDFPWEVSAKTGTAQKSGKINPPSEVEYVKKHLSSFGNMTWSQVKKEMKRLMTKYPETYVNEDLAVKKAVINLSGGRLTSDDIDRYKPNYAEFAWTIAMAPMDDPKIAVVCIIPQGVTGGNADPVVREIIGAYMEQLESLNDKDYKVKTELN